jgi:hypothetical protein
VEKLKAILGLLFLAVVAVLVAAFAILGRSSNTALSVNPAVKFVGMTTPVTVHLTNPHGVRRVSAFLEQDGARYAVYEQTAPARFLVWNRHESPRTVTFEAGKSKAPALKEGKARLVVEAVSNDFRGRTDTAETDVEVILSAPRVMPDNLQHYVNQGGMELVTFTAKGSWNEAGVRVGPRTFRSFPLRGQDAGHFSMFAYAWDLPPDLTPMVYARNQVGTEATGRFWFKLFPGSSASAISCWTTL